MKGVIEMKKIITSICLIALVGFFVCSIAGADETMCGTGKVTAIRLYESNDVCDESVEGFANNSSPSSFSNLCTSDVPVEACNVAIDFTTPNGQERDRKSVV